MNSARRPSPPRPADGLSPAQVRCLAAPTRQEIVDVLETAGPCAVATLAGLLGRPADALYHHLRRLVKVGLVAETGRRQNGRHSSAVYSLCLRPRLSYEPPARPAEVARVVAGAQRLSWREFQRAIHSGTAVTRGPRRTLWGGRAKGWATPDRLARINRLIAELLAAVRGGTPAAGATPVSVSFVLAPSSAATRRARAERPKSLSPNPKPLKGDVR